MNILGFFASIFKPASDIGKAYLDNRARVEEAKLATQLAKWSAKAQAYENEAQRTHSWEMEALRQTQYSWKDEFWTIILAGILLYPIIMGALSVIFANPMYVTALEASWKAFREMPMIFQILFPFVILAAIGIRWKGKQDSARAIEKLSSNTTEEKD